MGSEKEDDEKARYIVEILEEAEKKIGKSNSESLSLYSLANKKYEKLTKVNGIKYRKDLGEKINYVWSLLMEEESY